jgi:hypothetical protein
MTRGTNVLNTIYLGDAINKEDLRHLTADHTRREVQTKGQKMPPPPREPTPLEIAYRAQSSRIFRPQYFEQPLPRGMDPITYLIPSKRMSLEVPGFKTSDFQPTRPHNSRPDSQYAVQTIRDGHATAGRNASQMGFPIRDNVLSMDQSYQETPYHQAKAGSAATLPQYYAKMNSYMENTAMAASRKRGATEAGLSGYAMQPLRRRM